MSQYRSGDEILFQFEGLAPATVERVKFDKSRVRYVVKVEIECEIPERLVLSLEGRKGDKE